MQGCFNGPSGPYQWRGFERDPLKMLEVFDDLTAFQPVSKRIVFLYCALQSLVANRLRNIGERSPTR